MTDCAIVQQHSEKAMKLKRKHSVEPQAGDGDLTSKASRLV